MSERDELAKAIFIADNHKAPEVAADEFDERGPNADYTFAIAAALLAAGWRKPRTVTTSEELDALPDDSVILTATGIAVQLYGSVRRDEPDAYHFALTSGPATILHVGAQP